MVSKLVGFILVSVYVCGTGRNQTGLWNV